MSAEEALDHKKSMTPLIVQPQEIGMNEGGEALPKNAVMEKERLDRPMKTQAVNAVPAGWQAGSDSKRWYVLWTRSHCERRVFDQLVAKGLDLFLPDVDVWSRCGGLRRRYRTPMFPGYLFLHHTMDKDSYIEVRKARGMVRILGEGVEGWQRLAAVPDGEIEAIRKVSDTNLPTLSHPFLQEGRRVRIIRGPLADVEGILVQMKLNKGLLVLSVNLLQQSVAVEVDCTLVVPA